MKIKNFILLPFLWLIPATTIQAQEKIVFDFYGENIAFTLPESEFISFDDQLSINSLQAFYDQIKQKNYAPVIKALNDYKEVYQPDDWLFYQLIRKTAQQISPKAKNYYRYTLYKWYFLKQTGYDAMLAISGNYLLFYIQSDENIYNIPFRIRNGKQYVCINYHDYGVIDFNKNYFNEFDVNTSTSVKPFSYKVSSLPAFNEMDYEEKDIAFTYHQQDYNFRIKLNNQIKSIFANYPVVDYEYYFNIPMSTQTYTTLIPELKKHVQAMNVKKGVDYLMRFTRYAFMFEKDSKHFGKEKRLSPEQTLLYEMSDCEDRAALFFYLVREIYNLPMIVVTFPEHVTIAVKFDKPIGEPIIYNGISYSVCEPTPQKTDLNIGQLPANLKKTAYEVVYAYYPK